MVFASHVRLALLGSVALLSLLGSPAQATTTTSFQFTPCADNCVTSSGCQADSAKCMCKQARGIFLDSVISCMFFNCEGDLRNFQSAFLQPVESGCDASKRAIPSAKIKEAEDVASSYIAMLPSSPSPTAAPQQTSASPAPATTTTTTTSDKPSSSSAKQSSSSPPSTSTSSDDGGDDAASTSSSAGPTSSNAGETTTSAPTQVAAPSTSTTTQAAATASDSSSDSDSGGNFNTDPFASPESSAGSAVQPPPFLSLVLGVPVAVWMLATLR